MLALALRKVDQRQQLQAAVGDVGMIALFQHGNQLRCGRRQGAFVGPPAQRLDGGMHQLLMNLVIRQARFRGILAHGRTHGVAVSLVGGEQHLCSKMHHVLQGVLAFAHALHQAPGFCIPAQADQNIHLGVVDTVAAERTRLLQGVLRLMELVAGQLDAGEVHHGVDAQVVLGNGRRTGEGLCLLEAVVLDQIPGRVGRTGIEIRVHPGKYPPLLDRPPARLQLRLPAFQVQLLAVRQPPLQRQRFFQLLARTAAIGGTRERFGQADIGQRERRIDLQRGLIQIARVIETALAQCRLGQRIRAQGAQTGS